MGSPPRSPAGSTRSRQPKLVSYQRPRYQDRSKSRTTRIKEAISKPVNPAYTDRKTMENLSASMRSASELLERRRAEGTGRLSNDEQKPRIQLEYRGTINN